MFLVRILIVALGAAEAVRQNHSNVAESALHLVGDAAASVRTGFCPAGAHETTGRWVKDGWSYIWRFYFRYKNCQECTKAPASWKQCGTRGSQIGGKYGYGDEGHCKDSHGCRCTEKRQAGTAVTGFTMMKYCESTTFKKWSKCCDAAYTMCVDCATSSCSEELTCP
mmetsp:Transcript_32530/g.75213  ORF Transcript_32530/g.75213 Transcript_32530/m.75213 type:complete len:167 (+) Transcript_32530:69-569(+)